MTRQRAIEKVRKLRALTEARGATSAEATTARERADNLCRRFALTEGEVDGTPPQPPPPQPRPASMHPPGWTIVNLGGWVPGGTTGTGTYTTTIFW